MCNNKYLTRKEAAKYLNVHKSTLDAWAAKGMGPTFYKVGRSVRYSVKDLDDFMGKFLKK